MVEIKDKISQETGFEKFEGEMKAELNRWFPKVQKGNCVRTGT